MSGSETVYEVRLARLATRTIVLEHTRMEAISGQEIADRWLEGLMAFIRSLTTLPDRCVVAREAPLFPETTVRQLLYQHRRGGPAWRILFTVHEADEQDPPIIWGQLIRHGAQAPLAEWPSDEDEIP